MGHPEWSSTASVPAPDRREREADERERLADDREREADQRERLADDRERETGQRERLADDWEREAHEHLADGQQRFEELAGDLGIQAADARKRANLAMEHSRAVMAATVDRLKRSEAALRRMEANAARARMHLNQTVSEGQPKPARQLPGPRVRIEREEALHRRMSVMAAALAEAGEALAQIQEELAGHHPMYADEYRRSASQARKAAHQAHEIERNFTD